MTAQSCEQKVEFGVHHSAVLDVHRNKSLGLWVSIAIGTYRCTWLLMIHLAMLSFRYFSCLLMQPVCTVCLLRIVATVKQ